MHLPHITHTEKKKKNKNILKQNRKNLAHDKLYLDNYLVRFIKMSITQVALFYF